MQAVTIISLILAYCLAVFFYHRLVILTLCLPFLAVGCLCSAIYTSSMFVAQQASKGVSYVKNHTKAARRIIR